MSVRCVHWRVRSSAGAYAGWWTRKAMTRSRSTCACGRPSSRSSASSGCSAWTSTTAMTRTMSRRRTTMQQLERVHLVQFFLFEAQSLQLDRTSAIIAPNGAGKSALLDALQIVLLGGDRSRIRFNAQAGGSHRARTIRDYCLGVFRSGEEGRKRRTATTDISLVFRNTLTGEPLTAGIALGASADEPEHRTHGLYLLPGVALELDEHIERINGKELPLAWTTFREHITRRCKEVGETPQLHPNAERFVRDLLLRLRAGPSVTPDLNAYRKAFLNALNLQRV